MLDKALHRLRQTDWRIILGAVVTALWIAGGLSYLWGTSPYDIPLETLGSFLEGAFAPLAFLWLVIGLFIQQKELADNTEVLRQQSIHAAEQTRAMAAAELNARQQAYFFKPHLLPQSDRSCVGADDKVVLHRFETQIGGFTLGMGAHTPPNAHAVGSFEHHVAGVAHMRS